MHSATPMSGKAVLLYALAVTLSSMALCGAGAQEQPALSPIVGAEHAHVVVAGESWTTIGARAGVAPAVLASRNGRTVRTPLKPGTVIVLDNRHIVPQSAVTPDGSILVDVPDDGLIVNVPQRLVFYFADGRLQSHYPVAVGRADWQTPLGDFTVVLREEDPTWDVPVSIQEEMRRARKPVVKSIPPGPDNPLGRFWLGLSLGAVGIHGTIAPLSIYSFGTHGCIRLHPDDIEALYEQVPWGENGRIIYEPVLVAWDGADVYLEVQPDPYRRVADPFRRALELLDAAGLRELSDLTEVMRVVRRAEGLAVPVTTLEHEGTAGRQRPR